MATNNRTDLIAQREALAETARNSDDPDERASAQQMVEAINDKLARDTDSDASTSDAGTTADSDSDKGGGGFDPSAAYHDYNSRR